MPVVTGVSHRSGFSPGAGTSGSGSPPTDQAMPLKRPFSFASACVIAKRIVGAPFQNALIGIGPTGRDCTCTSRSGSAYGSGRKSTRSNSENTTVFTPIPSATVSGAAAANPFARANERGIPVLGTTRAPERFEALRQAGVEPLRFDGSASAEIGDALRQTTHLIVSVAPVEGGDPVLDAVGEAIRSGMPALEWIGYLSTVGVYGDHGGAWVDETAECRPVSRRSAMRMAAEREWLELGREIGRPLAILRLSGIYGPGRNALVNLEDGTARRLVKPGQVFNRIHCDDIAGALWHLADRNLGGIFNVTDDEPAPPQDVVAYAAGLMGIAPPPEQPFETAELSPMARSFYGENKRVSNAAIKKAGYAFHFPDYRSALDAMWRDGGWNASDARPVRSPPNSLRSTSTAPFIRFLRSVMLNSVTAWPPPANVTHPPRSSCAVHRHARRPAARPAGRARRR